MLTVVERTSVGKRWRSATPRWVGVPVTFALVVIGWVFFRAISIQQAWTFVHAMAGFGASPAIARLSRIQLVPNRSLLFLALGIAFVGIRAVTERRSTEHTRWRWVPVAVAPALLVLSLMQVVNTKFVPLIYFKF